MSIWKGSFKRAVKPTPRRNNPGKSTGTLPDRHAAVTLHCETGGVQLVSQPIRLIVSAPEHYSVRLTRDAGDIRAAQRLRFEVFNVELNEGLDGILRHRPRRRPV